MGIRRVPLSLRRVAALVLVFAILYGPIHGALVAIRAATATHDTPVDLAPTQRAEMGDRPDCW
jgi:hypothetical protein